MGCEPYNLSKYSTCEWFRYGWVEKSEAGMVTWEPECCAWSLDLILPSLWRFVSGSWDGKAQSQISMLWSMDDNIWGTLGKNQE